jgi:hypothetical protein
VNLDRDSGRDASLRFVAEARGQIAGADKGAREMFWGGGKDR